MVLPTYTDWVGAAMHPAALGVQIGFGRAMLWVHQEVAAASGRPARPQKCERAAQHWRPFLAVQRDPNLRLHSNHRSGHYHPPSMSQTPGAPHPTTFTPAQQAAAWRDRVTELQAADGWRLVPVQGKNPGITGLKWDQIQHTAASILATSGATGFGLLTGPQPTGGSVIAIDFDGLAGVQFAFDHGIDPTAIATWVIARTGADGEATAGRFKLLFTTTAEQAQRLGDKLNCSLWLTAAAEDHKREGIELFHHTGRQVVLLGSHPEGGHYFWPAQRGPDALAQLPDAWFDFVRAVIEARAQGGGGETAAERKERNAALGTTGPSGRGDWRRLRPREACPICGRTQQPGGNTHICAQHRSSYAIRCFDGSSFSYVAKHGLLKSGELVQGSDGQVYAFTSEGDPGFGMRGNFVLHKPRERPALPAQPQPWQPEPAPTTDWMAALPGGSNGNGHIDETPASEQVIDADVVQPGSNTVDEATIVRWMHSLAERIDSVGGDRHAAWSSEAFAPQWQAIVHAAAALQERSGAPSPTLKLLAGELFGITRQHDWSNLLKPRILELQQVRSDLARQARAAQADEAVALFTDYEGLRPPTGQEHKALLREMRGGPNDGKRMPLGALMKRFDAIAAARAFALRWNTVSQRVEYTTADGELVILPPEQVELLYTFLALCGYESGKQAVIDALVATARQNSYNPVQEYLRLVATDAAVPAFDLNTAASLLLGVDDPLSATLFRKTLISAVARAMQPGCKVDTILVLKGVQGTGKSTLWKALMPQPEWAIDTTPKESKDFLLQQHHCWVFELAELEQVTTKREAGELKAAITSAADMVRPPYGSAPRLMARHSVMVATCNRDDFLRDDTGSRRFWVIDIDQGRGLDLATAAQLRDAIWRAAFLAWQQGGDHCWWLDQAEGQALGERNGDYEPEGRFDSLIASWAARLPSGACFELPTALVNTGSAPDRLRCGDRELKEAARTLRSLGWVKDRQRVDDGRRAWLWHRAGEAPTRIGLQHDRPPSWPGY